MALNLVSSPQTRDASVEQPHNFLDIFKYAYKTQNVKHNCTDFRDCTLLRKMEDGQVGENFDLIQVQVEIFGYRKQSGLDLDASLLI
jgi:hypothetical protein